MRICSGTIEVFSYHAIIIGMMSTFLKTPNTLGTPSKRSEDDFDLFFCPQRAHTNFITICFAFIVVYGVMRIRSGTTEVLFPMIPFIRDDEHVSQNAKNARHALQASGARP